MEQRLIDDKEYRRTTFVVIDFEATTPSGRRPEPVDVAAIYLCVRDGELVETGRFSALIRPPDHAPITRFDTEQTGITSQMVAGQPPAAEVLTTLDTSLDSGPCLLVAHNAPTEAGILYDYREHCPQLATTDLLDTVRLARVVYPELPSYALDMLVHHLQIPRAVDRHRALPDVELTGRLFTRVIDDGARAGVWSSLRQVRQLGGYQAKATKPHQEALF